MYVGRLYSERAQERKEKKKKKRRGGNCGVLRWVVVVVEMKRCAAGISGGFG